MRTLARPAAVTLAGAAVLLVSLVAASNAEAAPDVKKLLGTWSAIKIVKRGETRALPAGMKLLATFKRGGIFISSAVVRGRKREQRGTWKVKGAQLTTRVRGKVESMTFSIEGKELRLRNDQKRVQVFMARQ